MEVAQCYRQRKRWANVKGKGKDCQAAVRTTAEQSPKERLQANNVTIKGHPEACREETGFYIFTET